MRKNRRKTAHRKIGDVSKTRIETKDISTDQQAYFEIPVVKRQQRNAVCYSGEMSISQLMSVTDVDNYDSGKGEDELGYQRNFTERRGREFGNFMSDPNNTCMGELMLNDRDGVAVFVPLKELLTSSPARKLSSVVGILRIPVGAKLYIYDGQTRRFGYIALLQFGLGNKEKTDYEQLHVPFSLEQVSYMEELSRFLDHNGRQAKVPNAHRASVVASVNGDSEIIKNLTHSEKLYALSAGVVRKLNDDRTSPWHHKIKMPDTDNESAKKLITTMASFHTGMKDMLLWMNKEYWSPETLNDEKVDDIVNMSLVFWRAMQKTCPKIWRNPGDYVMHVSQGVSSLSMLMFYLYKDFFTGSIDWNISNIMTYLKKSNILTTPKDWEKFGKISKRGGNFNQLKKLAEDIYMQIRRNI